MAKAKPICNLIEQDGNIFNLMGIVGRTLRQNDLPQQADEMSRRIMGGEAESYPQALAILREYVDIVLKKSSKHCQNKKAVLLFIHKTC